MPLDYSTMAANTKNEEPSKETIVTSPSFPKFGSLPPELRLAIWKLARPRQILEIRKYSRSFDENDAYSEEGLHISRSPSVPGVAQSCDEARCELVGQNKHCVSNLHVTYKSPNTNPLVTRFPAPFKPRNECREFWFDGDRDVLLMCWNMPNNLLNQNVSDPRISRLRHSVKHLMVRHEWNKFPTFGSYTSNIRLDYMNLIALAFSNLEVVSFWVGRIDIDIIGTPDTAASCAVSCLMVDLNDAEDNRRVQELFGRHHEFAKGSRAREEWEGIRRARPRAPPPGTNPKPKDGTRPKPLAKASWDDFTRQLNAAWKKATRAEKHPRPTPIFREVLTLMVFGVSLEGFGFQEQVFQTRR